MENLELVPINKTMNTIKVNVRSLLKFFDEKPFGSHGHAMSIVAIAGEDLGVGLLKHYLVHTKNAKVTILSDTPTTGKKKGSVLIDGLMLFGQMGRVSFFKSRSKIGRLMQLAVLC